MDDATWQAYLGTLAPEERCPQCGQPDNCGDCNHTPITDPEQRRTIVGGDAYRQDMYEVEA